MNTRKLILIAFFLLMPFGAAFANNLVVSNVSLVKASGQPVNTIGVKFDLTWDNSFSSTDDNGNAVFDRAWVFVKYWNTTTNGAVGSSNNAWKHATLISGGTIGDYSSLTGVGISSDKKGAFCKPGTNQIVYWNYAGTNGDALTSSDSFIIKVMAIEMVYVPQGAFYVGSGGKDYQAFHRYPNNAPYKIASEDAITVGTSAGNLYYPIDSTSGDMSGPIPAAFPKGYNGFYIMKYKITQGQYRDFLNTLTRAQQAARVETTVSAGTTSVSNRYVMSNATSVGTYRQGIKCAATIDTALPISFYCDLDGDDTPNESTDGEWVACSHMGWMDVTAYLDWAGLRPMTELELEKAGRGTRYPVPNEYVWGTTAIADSWYSYSNLGEASEGITTNYVTTKGNAIWTYGSGGYTGYPPVRVGIAAANASNSGRITAGATYYGIMDFNGNLFERIIPIGTSTSRSFTGTNGDGTLSSGGDADNSDWPTAAGYYSGQRIGAWNIGGSYLHLSNRVRAIGTNVRFYAGYGDSGGRGVRSAS